MDHVSSSLHLLKYPTIYFHWHVITFHPSHVLVATFFDLTLLLPSSSSFFFSFFSFLVIGFILPLLRNQVGFFSHNSLQGSKFQKPGEPTPDLGVRNISTMQAPKKLVQQSLNGMVLPPSRSMPPPLPPPPPKFNSPVLPSKVHEKSVLNKSKPESVPDTLIKLMEYGEEDDEPDEITEEPYKSNSNGSAAPKPFWAVWASSCIWLVGFGDGVNTQSVLICFVLEVGKRKKCVLVIQLAWIIGENQNATALWSVTLEVASLLVCASQPWHRAEA